MSAYRVVVVAAVIVGCDDATSISPTAAEPSSPATPTVAASATQLIVPGQRVGEFVIGRNSATSIWEYKKSRANAQWGQYVVLGLEHVLGPELQFDVGSGGELIGILVKSTEYVTEEGFRVGSLAADVQAALGDPLARPTEMHGGSEVLDYGGIVFATSDGRVTSIQVRKP